MTDTTFRSGTIVEAAWLNDVNNLTYGNNDAAKGSALLQFFYSGTSAGYSNVQAVLRNNAVNAVAWGVPNDGTDGTTQMTALMAAHLNIYLPPGNYLFSSSLTLRNGHTILGAGRLQTIITSGVIGDSLFKNTGSYTGFLYMADMQLIGNGLTGASGNGHAINLIDPAISSGSFTPAQSMFHRLYIRNFAGLDARDNGATEIQACAIIAVDALGISIVDPSIESCGNGIYFYLTQNCRIHDPLITGCAAWGIHTYDTENTIIYDGDVNTCGTNGVTDATGYLEAGMGTGNILDARNEGFVLIGAKIKGSPGTAQIHSFISSGEIASCWLRADHTVDKEYITVLITQPLDVHVHDNDFSPAVSAFSATRKVTNVKMYQSSTHNIAKVRVNDNQFRAQGGTITRANVHLLGFAGATRMEGLEVCGNSFGLPTSVALAATVDTDVLLDTGTFANCVFKGNNHYTETDVTKTAHYELASATYRYNDFDCNNYSSQVTGQIAGIFSGFVPGLETISGAKTFSWNDANHPIQHDAADATARVWQIPANSTVPYAIGDQFEFINPPGAGVLTLAVVTDTCTLMSAGSTGSRTLTAPGTAFFRKLTSTTWVCWGVNLT